MKGYGGPAWISKAWHIRLIVYLPTRQKCYINKHTHPQGISILIWFKQPYKIYFSNSGRILGLDQNENFLAFFVRILANLENFDVKMFWPGDFDVKIVRIWIILPEFFSYFLTSKFSKISIRAVTNKLLNCLWSVWSAEDDM